MKAASIIERIALRPMRVAASGAARQAADSSAHRSRDLRPSGRNQLWPSHLLLLLATVLAMPAAHAELEFNGFGQIVAASTLSNQHPFPNETYTSDISFKPESLLALQVRADLAPSLSATAQIVSEGDNDFTPKFAWAYASYQIGDHWTLKGGRQRVPLYEYSDFLQVGEAYPWVRPPLASYTVPLTNIDGFSLGAEYALGKWELHPRFIFGSFDGTAPYTISGPSQGQTLDVKAQNITGLALETVYDEWLSLRASYVFADGTIHDAQVDQLISTLQTLGDTSTVQGLAADNDQARFASVGFGINREHWLFGGEYTHVMIDNSFLPENSGYYVVAGYRFGRLMPLLTYGHRENKPTNPNLAATITPVQNPNPTPPPPQPVDCNAPAPPPTSLPCDYTDPACIQYLQYAGAVAGVGCLMQASHTIDDYYEVGLRYDISNRTALKLDYIRYLSGVPGTPGANLLSAAFTFNF